MRPLFYLYRKIVFRNSFYSDFAADRLLNILLMALIMIVNDLFKIYL